jgi:hypothetical protein
MTRRRTIWRRQARFRFPLTCHDPIMSNLLALSGRPHPGSAKRATPVVPGLAIALVAGTILGSWFCSRVTASVALRFVVFELLYTLGPGCLLYLLLSPAPGGRLRTIAIGWPLGYALELGAFALTAALHARGLFTLLPLWVLIATGPLLLLNASSRARLRALYRPARRSSVTGTRPGALPELVPVAVAVAAAALVLAFTFFASSPLPEHARSVAYSEDNIFDVTLAGEARHHWPITQSWVAGQPLHYYTGVFIHIAAVNQVTGIALSTVVMRLLPSVMFLIAALQLWALGRSVGRERWVGPLAVVLLLVTQDVNLDPTRSLVFYINPFTQFSQSPSFAFGVPFFLGALLLAQSHFARPAGAGTVGASRRRDAVRLAIMVGILMAGVTASKAFGAVTFGGGLGLYWLWCMATGKGSRGLTYCVVVAAVAALAIYFLMIAGGGSATLGLDPLNFLREGDALARATVLAKRIAGPSLYWLVLAAGSAVLSVCLLAPLLGAGWLIWRERGVSDSTALPVAVFLTGVAAYVLLGAPTGVEGVFLIYGYVALVPVAAKGLVRLWYDTPAQVRRGVLRTCGALLVLGLAIAALTPSLNPTGTAQYIWLGLAYGSVAGAITAAVWRFQGRYRAAIPAGTARIVACCIPLLTALALVKPIALAGAGAWNTMTGKPTSAVDSPSDYGMTAPLYRGLLWVRAHTNPCDVLAVSNHFNDAARSTSVYFYYSAFTERRVFLESWHYTAEGQYGAQPYPVRFALNNLATARGDPEALRELARMGVSYVLIDKSHGGGAPEPPSVSRLVFANSALDVYRLLAQRGTGHAERGCATIS